MYFDVFGVRGPGFGFLFGVLAKILRPSAYVLPQKVWKIRAS